MKKNCLLLVILLQLLTEQLSTAQSVFTRHLEVSQPAGYSTMIRDIQPQANGEFIIAGYALRQPSLPGFSKNVFRMTLNASGQATSIWSYAIPMSADPVLSTLKITRDGGLIFSCHVFDSSSPYFSRLFCKLDASGAIQWSKVMTDTMNLFLREVFEHINGTDTVYSFFGNAWNLPISNGKQPAVLTIDNSGNNCTAIYFGKWAQNDFFRSVISTTDNGFLMVTGNSAFSSQVVRQYSVFKMDQNLQLQWSQKFIPDPANTYQPREILEMVGKGYMLFVNANTGAGGISLLHRLDLNGIHVSAVEYGQLSLQGSSVIYTDSSLVMPGFNAASATDPVYYNFDSTGYCTQALRHSMDSVGAWGGSLLSCFQDSGMIFFGLGHLIKTGQQMLSDCGTTAITPPTGTPAQMVISNHVPDHITGLSYSSADSVFLVADSVIIQTIDACAITVGLAESASSLSAVTAVYPIPADDLLMIRYNAGFPGQRNWTLTDLSGRIMKAGTALSDQLIVEVADVPNGVYLLQTTGNSGAEIRKVVVQH